MPQRAIATMCTTNKNNCHENNNNESNYCNNNSSKESSFLPVLWVALVGFALVLNVPGCLGEQHPATADEGPLSEVLTAVGSEVALPCDLMPGTMIADKVQLVIWYRQGNVKPIYTFDARGRPLHQAVPWADENVFNKKAHFYYDTNPPALRIKNIQTTDAGLYKCRVDFHKSPTRNWRINVTVLVPPTQLTILDHNGAAVRDQTAGPYLEGDSINLTCLSSGGVPPPRVSWWREHALVDDSFQVLPDGSVRNTLHLKNIQRKDLLTMYTCQATNGHVVPALTKKVILDMNLPPLSLLLQGLNHAVVAGTRTHVTCTAIGARPPPHIIWSKAGQILKGSSQSTASDGNTTISELMLIPVPEDNERQVVCSIALNSGITSQQLHEGDTTVMTTLGNGNMGLYLKDSRVLNVTHAPIVNLNLGAPLDANNLLKGSDVYLECDVRANPAITRVEWYHNDKQLHSSRGIIISNQTLVLQGISKSSHGQYFCRATNLQGSVSSNEVYLDVKYPPVCKSDSTIIRAALKQTINITCEVDANPLDNLNYKWHFNNSLESLIELPVLAQLVPATLPLQLPSGASGGYYQRSKRKHTHGAQRLLHGRHGRVASIVDMTAAVRFEDDYDQDLEDHEQQFDSYTDYVEQPYTQMVYSNMVHKNHVDSKQPQRKQPTPQIQPGDANVHHINAASGQLAERKRLAALHKQQHHRQVLATPSTTTAPPLNNVYSYHVDSYESFGAISCVANSPMGHSQPCWYHIQPADLPEPVKNCTAYNATANSLQIQCVPGYDGGIPQHFHAQVYDELTRQILYNASYKYADFTVKRLPSDSAFNIRVTAVNAQGASKVAYRVRGRTLSAPLLRTASSTAVLVQLTPLLGALVGVIATLFLVAVCVVIFIKFRSKQSRRHANGEATTTEADKGSAEPLSRNMGSHSSLEDKNPDVVPQEANSEDEFHLEEKAFDRLNMESQRILYTPPTRINTASPPPPASLSPTFGKQYGELSLTTNPAFSLYNTPQRAPAAQRPVYTAPPPLLSTRTPPNIYTRIPGRGSSGPNGGATTYLPAYETRTSPTSPYGSTTTCTMPLLNGQSNGSLQTNSGSIGGGITCNTLPHPGSLHLGGVSAAMTSSVTSGNITIGAAQSLLTSPRTQTAYSTLGGGAGTQSPLLSVGSSLMGVVGGGAGNYETMGS
ncbi:nephrin isoform X1 [Drosophila hydei]|uniref:Nephrin isoform X1 n=1 Tax=Drosophila hydei TaxID=7224 RepID=A0A6J1LCH3_DROHY|nr:nephrin isoform X1 [Drosophila hydei]